eukprot:2224284-Pyramimonas_sp.AAC.1
MRSPGGACDNFARHLPRSPSQLLCERGTGGDMQFCTWNTRALLQYEGAHAAEKLGYPLRPRLGSSSS